MLVDLSVKDPSLSKSITFLTLLEYNFILGANAYIRFVPHPLYILLSTRNKGGGGVHFQRIPELIRDQRGLSFGC